MAPNFEVSLLLTGNWDRAEDVRWQTAKHVLKKHADYQEEDGSWASVVIVDCMDAMIRCVSGTEWPYSCGELHKYGQYPDSDSSDDHIESSDD